jgi:hypothetical protein
MATTSKDGKVYRVDIKYALDESSLIVWNDGPRAALGQIDDFLDELNEGIVTSITITKDEPRWGTTQES